MQFFDTDVDTGLSAGLDRFSLEYPQVHMQPIITFVLQDTRKIFTDTIAAWPDTCERRFVKLAAEMFAVAAAVRVHQSEPNFTADDCRCALGFFSWFLNSFKHQ